MHKPPAAAPHGPDAPSPGMPAALFGKGSRRPFLGLASLPTTEPGSRRVLVVNPPGRCCLSTLRPILPAQASLSLPPVAMSEVGAESHDGPSAQQWWAPRARPCELCRLVACQWGCGEGHFQDLEGAWGAATCTGRGDPWRPRTKHTQHQTRGLRGGAVEGWPAEAVRTEALHQPEARPPVGARLRPLVAL